MADRARRLARAVLDQQTITGLTEFATELEAAALEPAAQTVTHCDAVAVQQTEDAAGRR